ncbi:EndoU domain-containing protein [Priestia megaterium]|uniref:EndoU domain-containing protein n=1 Tax=Priestia megaterium TaxID=1404 RepID=UPI002A6B8743|nr:EndoU domain-containing protein [Priestia megaterium]MDY0943335.1 EndoU domain-containing protein [Priestia megaterium]
MYEPFQKQIIPLLDAEIPTLRPQPQLSGIGEALPRQTFGEVLHRLTTYKMGSVSKGQSKALEKVEGSGSKANVEGINDQDAVVKSEGKYNTGTMKHIYHGEINRRGKAVGYHHESMMGGKIIPGTEKEPDKNGVYEAKVEIDGKRKVAKSSFFPKEWNRVDVLRAIDDAYQNKKQIGSNKYIAETSSGIKIEMFLNKDGSIATAYPLYNK